MAPEQSTSNNGHYSHARLVQHDASALDRLFVRLFCAEISPRFFPIPEATRRHHFRIPCARVHFRLYTDSGDVNNQDVVVQRNEGGTYVSRI